MATVIAGMTTSLDGFVADANGSASALYSDFDDYRGSAHMNALVAQTGAVLMGRRTFEMADDPDWYVGNYEFQVPIFVLTHDPPKTPPKQDDRLTFTFVGDGIESAVEQAKAAAGEKAVMVVGGARVVQELLRVGLVDELDVDVMPVLLGDGLRLLENIDPNAVRLEQLDVQELGPRTNLRFRVANSRRERMTTMQKITPCLWFDTEAEEAAKFYTSVFPNSKLGETKYYGEAGPREAGTVLTVSFELEGKEFVALNGGPEFTFNEAVSFQVLCKDQDEVDTYWSELSEGGEEGPCGWLKDKYGLSWQIVPTRLYELLDDPDKEKSARAMAAMLEMGKIQIDELERAAAAV